MIVDNGKHFLYRHIRLDKDEPFYIGIGTKRKDYETYERDYTRAYSKKGRNYIWKGIVKRTDYEVEILLESNNYKFINKKEKEFIDLYGKIIDENGTLCNFTDGGDGTLGLVHKEDVKKQISKNSTKYKVAQYSLEGNLLKIWDGVKQFCDYYECTKAAVYFCLNGKYKTCLDYQFRKVFEDTEVKTKIGKVLSARERTIKGNKEKTLSEEHKEAIRNANVGKKCSEETKEKLRQHNLGKVRSQESIEKQIKAQLGKDGNTVKHIETGKIYNSLAKACRKLDLDYKREDARIRGNYSTKQFIIIE